MPTSSRTGLEAHDAGPGTPFFARTWPFAVLLLVTNVVAFIASFLLIQDRLVLYTNPDAALNCDVNAFISCGSVMQTWQAELLGVPNPIVGILGLVVVVTVAVAMLAGARFARWFWRVFLVGMTLALLLVIWFFTQAVYAIGILCPNCMVVWAMIIVMFVFTAVFTLNRGFVPAPAGLTRFVTAWAWPIVIVAWLVIGLLIFLRFLPLLAGI